MKPSLRLWVASLCVMLGWVVAAGACGGGSAKATGGSASTGTTGSSMGGAPAGSGGSSISLTGGGGARGRSPSRR